MTHINCSTIPELPNIEDVPPLSEDDFACLTDVRNVLMKHNRLSRFGVTLLHSHFPVGDNEMLMETCDPENRRLTIEPVSYSPGETEKNSIPTNWRLDLPGDVPKTFMHCTQFCGKDPKTGIHFTGHNYTR